MTHAVRFMDNVTEAYAKVFSNEEVPVWLEIGPGTVLSSLLSSILPTAPLTVSLLPPPPYFRADFIDKTRPLVLPSWVQILGSSYSRQLDTCGVGVYQLIGKLLLQEPGKTMLPNVR